MKHLAIIAIALVVLIVVSIGFSSPQLPDGKRPSTTTATTTTVASKFVSLSTTYRRGTYTMSGSIVVPTVCHTVTTETALVPSTTPPVIRLNLTVPQDTGRCLQLPATTTFSATQKAARHAVVDAYLNGALVATSTAQ